MPRDLRLVTWSKVHVAIRVRASHSRPLSYRVRCRQALWHWRYNGFSLSLHLVRTCDQRVMQLYRSESLKVSHHSVTSGCHRYCGSGDNSFSLSGDLKWPRDQMVTWFCQWETWLESKRYFKLISPILVTRSMGNEWRNTSKKALSVCFWNTNKEGKKQAFAKPFASHANI